MRTKPVRCLAVAATLLLFFTACGKKDDSKSGSASATTTSIASPVTTTAMKDLSSQMAGVKLVSAGKLTICSDIPHAPFEFPDDAEGGKLSGFDVNLVDAMATSLGLTTEWQTTPVDTIIAALAAGNCDIIASATTITDERKQQVNFTTPYFDTDQSLLVKTADKSTYANLSDLAGKTIGVQAGTTGEEYANANTPPGATIKSFPGADDLFAALASNDIQAILQDYPVNQYRAHKNPNQFAVTESLKTGELYGIAVAKTNTELLAALDSALAEAKSTNTYDFIYTEWFGPKQS